MGETWSMIWTSRKAILNSFFSENCHYQDSDTGNEINDLSRQYSSTFVLFSIEISFEEFSHNGGDIQVWLSSKNNRNSTFSTFRTNKSPKPRSEEKVSQ